MKNHTKSAAVHNDKIKKLALMFAAVFIVGFGENANTNGHHNTINATSQQNRVNNPTPKPGLAIDIARWNSGNKQLFVSGNAPPGADITINNASTNAVLGTTRTAVNANNNSSRGDNNNDGEGSNDNGNNQSRYVWTLVINKPTSVPCRVSVTTRLLNAKKVVANAPENCDRGSPPPAGDQPPNGTITSPIQNISISVGGSVAFQGEASDPDGDTQLTYLWDFGGGAENSTALNPGSVTFNTAGQFTITFTATDSHNLSDPTPDTRIISVGEVTLPPTSHAGLFDTYEGSKTCLGCHATEVNEAHASVHYQWQGPTPYVVNMAVGGKLHGINDFCGYPDINFIGQLINLDGVTVDGGCATCHTGMGAKPDPVATQTQLENIDCLSCHSDSYRRKVVKLADGSFHFEVAPEKMTVPVIQAITDIQRAPTRGACVNCHSYAGGGCNNKRGDLEEEHRNPGSASFDVHMAPKSVGGAGLSCVDCHITRNHRVSGRGVDLRPTDLDIPVRCTNCHSQRPHNNNTIDKHTARVDCTVCHIPEFAKVASTDMVRDYSKPPTLDPARQLYDPNMERASNVKPEIAFWNGTSEFYQFGSQATLDSSARVLMAGPLGDINDGAAKLFAFKHHLAVLPHDPVSGRILPMKMGILFQSGDVDRAITVGVSELGWSLPQGYDFIGAERYMGIFHEVSPANDALGCNDCHNGGTRVDFTALGYRPRPERDPNIAANCASGCHGNESDEWSASTFFTQVHARHVDRQGFTCSRCHGF